MSERLTMNHTKIHPNSVPLFLIFFLSNYTVLVLLETDELQKFWGYASSWRRRDLRNTILKWGILHCVYVSILYIGFAIEESPIILSDVYVLLEIQVLYVFDSVSITMFLVT